MKLSEKLKEFRTLESDIRVDSAHKIYHIQTERDEKLRALKQDRRMVIFCNMPFRYGDRLYYYCDKGSGYYGIFKGIRNYKVVMEITTKTGRRKFRDFEINMENILALRKI